MLRLTSGVRKLASIKRMIDPPESQLNLSCSVQKSLHAMQATGGFSKAGLLLKRFAIVFRRIQILFARLVNTAEIKVGKGVRLIARRIQGTFEPAHAAVRITFSQQVAANVVVRIPKCLVHPNSFQTFRDRFVIAILKTINPTEKSVGLGGGISFDRTLLEFD